jgi:hypothetical protein
VSLAARAARTATLARSFTAKAGITMPAAGTEATNVLARESADGFWLTARGEKELKSLAAGTQTQVSARLLIGSHPAAPIAYEMMFNGRLSIAAVGAGGNTLTGSVNGLTTIGAFKADQAKQQETEILFIAHMNLNATLAYAGDDQNGSVTLTLQAPGSTDSYIFTKTYAGTAHVTYMAAISTNANVVQLAKLDLLTDTAVVDPANQNHVLAQNGLDIV